MNTLYLLQFACCVTTALMALMLACSRFQIRWLNHRYEVSRWLLCLSMCILSMHYVLQMSHAIRANSDMVGAVVNILFYTPIAYLISYATYNVVCGKTVGRKFFVVFSCISYLLIVAVFGIGAFVNGSAEVGAYLYFMLALFVVCLCYCIFANVRAMRRHRRIMEESTAADMLPYDRFSASSYMLMGASALVFTVAIIYRPFLYVFGPLMLLSLFVFTMSFIGYGYNIIPSDVMLEEAEEEDSGEDTPVAQLDENDVEQIRLGLEEWCESGGFRDCNANLLSISQKMGIPKDDLTYYFEQCQSTTFRLWLSDIRFREAQRIMQEHPELNNDTISSECGFSSHAHLYKVFKTKTGMTPGQWKRKEQ